MGRASRPRRAGVDGSAGGFALPQFPGGALGGGGDLFAADKGEGGLDVVMEEPVGLGERDVAAHRGEGGLAAAAGPERAEELEALRGAHELDVAVTVTPKEDT